MSEKIRGDVMSPMIKDGVLSWCEGDTFTVSLLIRLLSTAERVTDLSGYSLEASFFDRSRTLVHKFEADGDESCVFQLVFDGTVSPLFRRGRYVYDVAVTSPDGTRTTVACGNPAAVR